MPEVMHARYEYVLIQRKSEHTWAMSCGSQITEMNGHTASTLLEKLGDAGFAVVSGGGGIGPGWFVLGRIKPLSFQPNTVRAQFMGVSDEEQPDLGLQEQLKTQVTVSDLFDETGWVSPENLD